MTDSEYSEAKAIQTRATSLARQLMLEGRASGTYLEGLPYATGVAVSAAAFLIAATNVAAEASETASTVLLLRELVASYERDFHEFGGVGGLSMR